MDIKTLLFSITVTSVVLAITMGVIGYRRRVDCLTIWALAVTLHAGAYLLMMLRPQVGDLVSIIGANLLLVISLAVFTEGLAWFQQRRPPRWLVWLPVPLLLVTVLIWIDDIQARVIVNGIITGLQCLLLLILLWQERRTTIGVGQLILGAALLLILVTLTLRLISVAMDPSLVRSITTASPIQVVTFLVSLNSLLLLSIGLIVMTKERVEARLRAMALHDALTGLPNRILFDEHMATTLAQARRDHKRFGLMFVDLDGFKGINDTLGHRVGDLLLQGVAERLTRAMRASDTPGRISGDEFVILMRDLQGPEDALRVAERIQARLVEPFFIEGHPIAISASLGIALFPEHGTDAIALSRNADAAMYRSKAEGRNRVSLAEGPSGAAGDRRARGSPAGETRAAPGHPIA